MSFFKGLKDAGNKAKLKGEILLLDQKRTARIRQFGVDLYDKIAEMDKQRNPTLKSPAIFHAVENKIADQLAQVKADMNALEAELGMLEEDIEKVQVQATRGPPATTNQEKAAKAGQYISNTGKEAKMQVQSQLVQRKIRQRKEQFGLEVYDLLEASGKSVKSNSKEGKGIGGQITAGISNQLSKLSSSESEIQACIDRAKSEISSIDEKKGRKEREIANIDEGVL